MALQIPPRNQLLRLQNLGSLTRMEVLFRVPFLLPKATAGLLVQSEVVTKLAERRRWLNFPLWWKAGVGMLKDVGIISWKINFGSHQVKQRGCKARSPLTFP